jgi:hypothetical protein
MYEPGCQWVEPIIVQSNKLRNLDRVSAAREYKPKTCTVLDFKINHGLQRGGSVGWMNLKFINA